MTAPASSDPAAELPPVIRLPDQSQPEPPPPRPKPGRHTGKMKGRHFGPQPVAVADRRTAFIPPTRCTPAFRAAAEAKARAAGMSLGAFVCAVLGDVPNPRAHRAKPGPDVAALVRVLAALGRSGNNLNQICRRLNAYDFGELLELQEMRAAMLAAKAEHHAVCEQVRQALGV